MITINESFINTLAPNAAAVTNGQELIKKNSFTKLSIDKEESLISGLCKGSGKEPYSCSADFIKPEKPVFRCNCPSRQLPCKHVIALMYAYVRKMKFTIENVPDDILEKRQKLDKKDEPGKTPAPKKTNKAALAKKIKTQIEGLDFLKQIINDLIKAGLGTFNEKSAALLEEQVKQLGDFYLAGPQSQLREFLIQFEKKESTGLFFNNALELLSRLHSVTLKAKEYLAKRLENPDLPLETDSTIDEWLGFVWQLSDLKEAGRVMPNAQLIQLAFNSFLDEARKEYVDSGLWINLNDGSVQETLTYRPLKAVKNIKEEDSCFQCILVPELYIYPGFINSRIRFNEMTFRDLTPDDYTKIRGFAGSSIDEIVKRVKNVIKQPLADKEPVVLLNYDHIRRIGDILVVSDKEDKRLVLKDSANPIDPGSCRMLSFLDRGLFDNQVMLLKFHHNWHDMELTAQPLAIVSSDRIIRLTY